MPERRTNPPFLNGVPELLILRLLSREAMHGYQLVQAIRAATNEAFAFGEANIYPILHKLKAQEQLQSRRESAGGRSRIVYRVTAKGRKQLAETTETWQRVARAINHALRDRKDEQPSLA
jgi:PadR family transcriptional regulator PadR